MWHVKYSLVVELQTLCLLGSVALLRKCNAQSFCVSLPVLCEQIRVSKSSNNCNFEGMTFPVNPGKNVRKRLWVKYGVTRAPEYSAYLWSTSMKSFSLRTKDITLIRVIFSERSFIYLMFCAETWIEFTLPAPWPHMAFVQTVFLPSLPGLPEFCARQRLLRNRKRNP